MSEEIVHVEQKSSPRGMPGITWAVILIAVGVVFLINNLHIGGLSINWLELLRFWPVILILVGLDVLIGRRSVFGSLAVAALSVVVIGGLVWMVGFTENRVGAIGASVTRDVNQALGDVKTADIEFHLGVGETNLSVDPGSSDLVAGTYTTNRDLALNVAYQTKGDNGVLVLKQENVDDNNWDMFGDFIGRLDLKLTDSVPLTIVLDAGVGNVSFDLTGLKLSSLRIKGGVGNVEVTLPAEGDYKVSADMGIGQLTIYTPKTLEASLDVDSGISNTDVPDRYSKTGESTWQTAGYGDARDRVALDVHTGIGNMEIIDR